MRQYVFASSVVGFAALSLVTGCPDRTISEVNPQQGRVEYKDIPVTINRDVDILFLIDDSPSMADKQNNLRMNFPNFINVLNSISGGLPNIHLGVTTSDLGSKGADDPTAGPSIGGGQGACLSSGGKNGNLQTYGTPLVTGTFISDILAADGTRTKNYTGMLTDAFTAIATTGQNGCGFEQHIEAVKRALNNNPANAGFLRPDAYLAVVIVGDEDDCSFSHSSLIAADTTTLGPLESFRCTRFGVICDTGGATPDAMNQVGMKAMCHSNENPVVGTQYLTKVDDYVTFLKGLKADPLSVIVADIGAPPTPVNTELRPPEGGGTAIPALAHSCTYVDTSNSTEVGDPTVRVNQLLNGFPNRSTYSTICQQDLSGALTEIANLLKTVIGSPCIDGTLADVDPNTPGPQYDCSVSDVLMEGQPNQTETVLPECNNLTPGMEKNSTNLPCWAIESDPTDCLDGLHLTLKVERATMPPSGDHVVSYCVTEACAAKMGPCVVDSDCCAGTTCGTDMTCQ